MAPLCGFDPATPGGASLQLGRNPAKVAVKDLSS